MFRLDAHIQFRIISDLTVFSLSPDNHSLDNDNEMVLDIQIDKTDAYNVTVSNITRLTSAPTFLCLI